MRVIQENFDDIHFSESCLGEPKLEGLDLVVPVSGLYVMDGHPLAKEKGGPFKGVLRFKSVASSNRTISEYVGDSRTSKEFKEPRDIDDGPFTSSSNLENVNEYGFEGFLEDPESWVNDWVVKSKSFEFECHD